LRCDAICRIVLQCFGVLQCVAVCCSATHRSSPIVCVSPSQGRVAVCCSVLQCVASLPSPRLSIFSLSLPLSLPLSTTRSLARSLAHSGGSSLQAGREREGERKREKRGETGNTLQHTATHCNALQRTATHCNVLQRTATQTLRALSRVLSHAHSVTQVCRVWE